MLLRSHFPPTPNSTSGSFAVLNLSGQNMAMGFNWVFFKTYSSVITTALLLYKAGFIKVIYLILITIIILWENSLYLWKTSIMPTDNLMVIDSIKYIWTAWHSQSVHSMYGCSSEQNRPCPGLWGSYILSNLGEEARYLTSNYSGILSPVIQLWSQTAVTSQGKSDLSGEVESIFLEWVTFMLMSDR